MGFVARMVSGFAFTAAVILMFIGTLFTAGINWMAAAIIAWVSMGLLLLGVFAWSCAKEIGD